MSDRLCRLCGARPASLSPDGGPGDAICGLCPVLLELGPRDRAALEGDRALIVDDKDPHEHDLIRWEWEGGRHE